MATQDDDHLSQPPPGNLLAVVDDVMMDPNSFFASSDDEVVVKAEEDVWSTKVDEEDQESSFKPNVADQRASDVEAEDDAEQREPERAVQAVGPAVAKAKPRSRRSSRPNPRPADLRKGARVRVHWPKMGPNVTFDGVVTEILEVIDGAKLGTQLSFTVSYDDGVSVAIERSTHGLRLASSAHKLPKTRL
jgi:hypothetical protein